eukprot:sb/3462808/
MFQFTCIVTAPFASVLHFTKRFMTSSQPPALPSPPPPAPVEQPGPSQVTKVSTCTQSVQTAMDPPLTVSEQRQAIRRHVIKKSTIQDVIQLEQREKYRQLLNRYTKSDNALFNTTLPAPAPLNKLSTSYLTSTPAHPARLAATSPARPITSMSPPSSDTPCPVYQNKRMIRGPPGLIKKSSWTNPFDSKWLENWHKVLTETVSDNERRIKEMKKGVEDAKQKVKEGHDLVDQKVDKSLLQDEISEDEAIGDEIDTFPPLTEEMMMAVDRALSGGPLMETLVDHFNIGITRKDVQTLKDLTWLNDEVINFYFNLLMDRSKKVAPSIHIFNTFFYPRLLKVGHQGLARWTRKVDLFAKDLIMIPIHLGMHWCLAVIDNRTSTITYYDSLLGDNHQCTTALRDYMVAEHMSKKKQPMDPASWKLVIEKDLPEQMNGCDCGVFACKETSHPVPHPGTSRSLPTQVTKVSTCTQSVQTAMDPPLRVSEQRHAIRRRVIKKSTIQDVIQLEQVPEKYRQLLNRYTKSDNALFNTTLPAPAPLNKLSTSYLTSTPAHPARLAATSPARPSTSMSPPSSDSGKGSGSEASGPMKKGVEDAKQKIKSKRPEGHDLVDQKVDKSLLQDEISEDEAIGDEIDTFPPLTEEMMMAVESRDRVLLTYSPW